MLIAEMMRQKMILTVRSLFQLLLLISLLNFKYKAEAANVTDCQWTQSVEKVIFGGTPSNSTSISECQANCMKSNGCQGVNWEFDQPNGKQCSLVFRLIRHEDLLAAEERNISHFTLRCRDCSWAFTSKVNILGGKYTSAATVADCQAACLKYPGCVAIDWDWDQPQPRKCYFLPKQTGKQIATTNVSHYDLFCTDLICPKNWTWRPEMGVCYYFSGEDDTYNSAKQKCKSISANLARLNTFDDLRFFGTVISAARKNCADERNCQKVWVNAAGLAQSQYGDNSMYSQMESGNVCGYAFSTGRMENADWNLDTCNKSMKYTCSITLDCPAGFDRRSWSDSCYKVIPETMTWSNAWTACRNMLHGSRLTMLLNAFDYFTASAIADQNSLANGTVCDIGTDHQSSYWIGAQTKDPKNCSSPIVWKPNYVDTLPLNLSLFTYWISGQPDCSHGIENCVQMSQKNKYLWSDEVCNWNACPLCQRPFNIN